MSNEELSKSLRTEIQTYLKNTVADLQQEIAEMQERVNAEIERHRGELEKSFQALLSKGSAAGIDDKFAHLIGEHLQMAFEDGSKEGGEAALAAAASAAAVNDPDASSGASAAAKSLDYTPARDAINDISFQASQADILKSLIKHASNFVPRGAFFIIKKDHLVGWRVFGNEVTGGDESVREVFLSLNSNNVLSESIRQNSVQHAAQGDYPEDAVYLQKLNFGQPEQMTAIPLVVRGRGVAVLYADAGENGSAVQVEALESLVRVAGLTVELLASRTSAPKQNLAGGSQPAAKPLAATPVESQTVESQTKDFSFSPAQPTATFAPSGKLGEIPKSSYDEDKNGGSSFYPEPVRETVDDSPGGSSNFSFDSSLNTNSQNQQFARPADNFSGSLSAPSAQQIQSEAAFSFDTTMPSYAAPQVSSVEPQLEAQIGTQPLPRRSGDRNSELPIDVPEDERRQHNDARRFARLLVSEIKLYNEQKVKEGRQAKDLYSRLREAVERSREMYDKRVAPPVAARFDYFHYELVNTLAEGDEGKLGDNYPGATV